MGIFLFLLLCTVTTIGDCAAVRVRNSKDTFAFLKHSDAPTVLYLFLPIETTFEEHRHYLQKL